MTNMVERVARLIDPEGFERWEDAYRRRDGWDQIDNINRLVKAREKARAVIAAMRTPTPDMVSGGGLALATEFTDPWDVLSPEEEKAFGFEEDGEDAYDEACKRMEVFAPPMWSAMIDAALREPNEEAKRSGE